jgi:hypothetical protein
MFVRGDVLEFDRLNLTNEIFVAQCLVPNIPAIIRNCGPIFEADGLRRLVLPSSLLRIFGAGHSVPISGENGIIGAFFESASCSPGYLKDWHFVLEHARVTGNDPRAPPYNLPDFLSNDWLNDYCLRSPFPADREVQTDFGESNSDYRFAYIGPEGSQTLLHYDVFGSFSWSLNVCGEKLWLFPTYSANELLRQRFPPGRDSDRPVDLRTTTDFEFVAVMQRPGDLVFVPSHYFHQVHNTRGEHLEGCLAPLVVSVNHNWINEFCFVRVVAIFCAEASAFLRMAGLEAKAALGEEWPSLVDRSLMTSGSWNFAVIGAFICFCKSRYGNGLSALAIETAEQMLRATRLQVL